MIEFIEFFFSKQGTKRKEQQTISLSFSPSPLKRINFNPRVVKVSAQRNLESFHSIHEGMTRSSRAESAPVVNRDRVEQSVSINQSDLADCLIIGTRVQYGQDATNAKSSFPSIFSLFLNPSFFLDFLFESGAIFIGGNRIFFQTPRESNYRYRFQRMPARNQTANTAGNADPDNSTDDRFWHRSQRGRGNTDTVDMLYQPAKV